MSDRTIAASIRCKRPGCRNQAKALGLCASDYATAYRCVADGETTWEELRRKGRIDPKRPSAKAWLLNE